MIIEMTLLTDKGEPFLVDGCSASLIIEDKKTGNQVRVNTHMKANKLIYHVPLNGDEK
jgi:hypothetical protein